MGPCMCGDPYCPSCGTADARTEAAAEWATEELAKAGLTPDEYSLVVKIGLLAVEHTRKATETAKAIENEMDDFDDETWDSPLPKD
jgi:hypothetical protein